MSRDFMKILLIMFILSISLFSNNHMITPIPNSIQYDKEKALLGKKLFYDVRLSKNNDISCASCHFLEEGGDDNIIGAIGKNGKIIPRNSPTVFNAVFNEFQHWDAGVKDLNDQAINSITHPLAMDSNFTQILSKLKDDIYYKNLIKKLFGETINKQNILDSIVEFERALITPNSKFDKYLNGDKNILTQNEIAGYNSFKDYGCISCHNGVNIGGNLIQKLGILKSYKTNDFGRYYITENLEDMYFFKVPSLRNVALTAPYLHDGNAITLRDAVEKMIEFQVGYTIKETDIKNILEFLETLTGEIPDIAKKNNE